MHPLIGKALQATGVLAICIFVLAATFFAYELLNNNEKVNRATSEDVRFVLNWGGLNAKQNYKVVSSIESTTSLTGDHLDHYCIQLSETTGASPQKNEWLSPDKLSWPLLEVAANVFEMGKATKCFSATSLSTLTDATAYFWSTTLHGQRVTAYDAMLIDTKTKRLFYVSLKT